MKRKDKAKKQTYFHAELLPEVAARGFERQQRTTPRRLSWAEWAGEPRLGFSPS